MTDSDRKMVKQGIDAAYSLIANQMAKAATGVAEGTQGLESYTKLLEQVEKLTFQIQRVEFMYQGEKANGSTIQQPEAAQG